MADRVSSIPLKRPLAGGPAFWRLVDGIRGALRRRATVRALARMDDAALDDIGVSRAVLPHATLYAAPPVSPGAQKR
ncbi:DUF1127 domain-containing protein [Acuticoccus sp. I52.16.1]|uniref:DUF1127 domain-containing protein n=1 Tax=Acuticoccus sp. I52.16.1 TaxID=2928472 RepID=UPI001FCFCCAD|nr:DUF1127 domain-containing protein [Acuticoccus sp. I52.16.1]UOM36090.1 DUF1127 domain-containing protein [Acuticoccus sp. I52.16.1]